MKRTIGFLLLVTLVAALITGCSGQSTENSRTVDLTVSAAASLTDAMEEIKTIYGKENSKISITYNFGSSGALQRQIEQGAPADLFISAAVSNMDALQKNGLILDETRKDLLLNKIVLIAPVNSSLVSDYKDLAEDKIKKFALGEPESVPAGKYGKEVLTNLGIWDQVNSKAVFAKDVRQVLNYVETENTDAGIVYQTDAIISEKVKIIAEAPAGSHTPVVYPLAAIKSSKNQQAAKDFAAFLAGDKARTVFEKYGFTVIE